MHSFSPAHRAASLVFALLALLPPAAAFAAGPRDVVFGGVTWGLRQTSGPMAPGPTTFSNSEDHVWIDARGFLHMTVKKRDGVWTGSELMSKSDAKYGSYEFEIEALKAFDPNLVFGFFSWDRNPGANNREIDIELSQWGKPDSPLGWFTVQPYDTKGNQHSFALLQSSSHRFRLTWQPGIAAFEYLADGRIAATWTFRGEVPDLGRARFRINFWMFQGRAPMGEGPYEIVLKSVTHP